MNISKYPLLRQAYELCLVVEGLPASLEQTALSIKASELSDAIWNHLEKLPEEHQAKFRSDATKNL